MLTEAELAARLLATPAPVPPSNLLAELKRDLRLPVAAPRPQRRPFRNAGWRRWSPLAGFAAAAGLVAFVLFLPFGGSRTFANATGMFRTVQTLHAVRYERLGPAHPVQRDASKPVNAWPNFSTSLHPANPLVRTEIYYRLHEQGYPQWVTVQGQDWTWNQQNWELRENRQTGQRRFRLNSAPPNLETLVAPAVDSLRWKFAAVPNLLPSSVGDENSMLARCWTGESRFPGTAMGEHTPEWHLRLWFEETPGWIRRLEWLSDDYTKDGRPWVFQVLEFPRIDQPIPDVPFDLELRDSDLQPLGISRTELSRLSAGAFSAEITGSADSKVQITIQEPGIQRQLSGTLPLRIVHDPRDATEIRVRFTDGQPHSVGVQVNALTMSTSGKGLRVRVLPTGETEASSVN